MTMSIAMAIVALVVGGFIFFRSEFVDHRIGLPILMVTLIVGSFLYDNAAYLFSYCRYSEHYLESSGEMTHFEYHRSFYRASVTYSEGNQVRKASMPVAFYEEAPQRIPIMLSDRQGLYARVTRTQIIISGRTLFLMILGGWIILTCALKSPSKGQ